MTATYQIMILTYTNLFCMIYIGIGLFKERKLRRLQLFEEFLNCVITWHMFYFTDFCPSPHFRYHFGWSMIFIASAYCFFQMSMFLITLI